MTSRLLVDKIEGKTTANTIEMPSGSVIQFVDHTFDGVSTIQSASYTSITSGSVTITPKFSSSKILIMACVSLYQNDSNQNYIYGGFQFKRGSTVITTDVTDNSGSFAIGANFGGSSSSEIVQRVPFNIIDSPNTTSATTYSMQGRVYNYANTGGYFIVNPGNNSRAASTIHAMEIAQ